MQLPQSLRPPGLKPARPRSSVLESPVGQLTATSATSATVGRRRQRLIGDSSTFPPRWIVPAATRNRTSSIATTTTKVFTTGSARSEITDRSTLATAAIPAGAASPASGSAGTALTASGLTRMEPKVARTPPLPAVSELGWQRMGRVPTGCGARQQVVSYWRPGDAAGGGGIDGAAADGESAGNAEAGGSSRGSGGGDEGGREAGDAGVHNYGEGTIGGSSSSRDVSGGGFGGSSSPTLTTEHILEVCEAYVDAWWRGVARGSDAAVESLRELVATGHLGAANSSGSSSSSSSSGTTGSWGTVSVSASVSGGVGVGGGGGGDGDATARASDTTAAAATAASAADADVGRLPSSGSGQAREHTSAQQQQQQNREAKHPHHPHHHHHGHHHNHEHRNHHQSHLNEQQKQQQHDHEHEGQPHGDHQHKNQAEHPHQRQEVLALMPDGVLHRRPLRGYDALIGQLAAQHTEYHRVQYRPVTSAASPASSCGYVLGEFRMQDVGGLAGHPATFRVSRGYCLFKLRVDPNSGRITRGWVRRQMTQEERDERVWDPVHVYPAPFPLENLHLTRGGHPDPRVMEEAARAWVAAQAKPPPPRRRQLDLRPEAAAAAGDSAAAGDAPAADIAAAAPESIGSEGGVSVGGGGPGGLTSLSTAGYVSSVSPQLPGGGIAGGGAESSPREIPPAAAATTAAAAPTTPEQARLREHVLAAECRLLDAYGLFPDPEEEEAAYGGMYGGGRRTHPVVGAEQVLRRLQAQQRRCTQIEPMLYDVAVSEDHNIAFVHWVNIVTPAQELPAPKPVPPAPARPSQQQLSKAAAAGSLSSTRGSEAGSGRTTGLAVAASSAASAAATAASAAAQAATAAADVATTAASAASVAANSASTAATIAATAATAAAFAAGSEEAEAQLKAVAKQQPSQQQLQPQQSGADTAAMGIPMETVEGGKAAPAAPPETAAAEGSSSKPSAGLSMGLQDLRLSMPTMPTIPKMPELPIQIQNIEEALSAAAQRVGHAAGTAAAAASAAAAAATAVIMAETAAAGGGGGQGNAKVVTTPQRKAAPPAPPLPLPYQQECMAALLFRDDGTVSDVWLFRGPFHFERKLLRP